MSTVYGCVFIKSYLQKTTKVQYKIKFLALIYVDDFSNNIKAIFEKYLPVICNAKVYQSFSILSNLIKHYITHI